MNYKFIQNQLMLIKTSKENTVTVDKDFIITIMEEVLAARRKKVASRKRSGSKHPNNLIKQSKGNKSGSSEGE